MTVQGRCGRGCSGSSGRRKCVNLRRTPVIDRACHTDEALCWVMADDSLRAIEDSVVWMLMIISSLYIDFMIVYSVADWHMHCSRSVIRCLSIRTMYSAIFTLFSRLNIMHLYPQLLFNNLLSWSRYWTLNRPVCVVGITCYDSHYVTNELDKTILINWHGSSKRVTCIIAEIRWSATGNSVTSPQLVYLLDSLCLSLTETKRSSALKIKQYDYFHISNRHIYVQTYRKKGYDLLPYNVASAKLTTESNSKLVSVTLCIGSRI